MSTLSSQLPDEQLLGLPFPEQIEAIEERLTALMTADEAPGALLATLAGFPDHEPLAYALRVLLSQGESLSESATQDALCDVLFDLPDTGVRRVLRGLERMILSQQQLEQLSALVIRVLERWPIERIAVLCLADRWLKNAAPGLRLAWRAGVLEDLRETLRRGEADAVVGIEAHHLLHLPGEMLSDFMALAKESGCLPAWQSRLDTFADTVLSLMRRSPRSLSQANAEELLSRRVYTDPGHFLIELFQNAEDAKARHFGVDIGTHAVSVRHDGVPFDAKDVVGVLSIGQTTKAREQIGFFGVGFKSVYEICERPQIYSALFCFEIADVSIPRRLTADIGRGDHETLLMLPYRRAQGDEDEAPEERAGVIGEEERNALFQRALAVPPETLLTLQHLQAFSVSCGEQRRTVIRRAAAHKHVIELHLEEQKATRLYRVVSGHFVYDGPQRELNRAMETGMLIAIAIDEAGRPQPIPAERPTLFSHLPTDERSGLRFLLHAHFELPVDRERLDLSSPWNRWALVQAGRLLVTCVAQLCEEAADGDAMSVEMLRGLALILPLPSELRHEAYRALLEVFRDGVQALAMLPAAGGGWLTPMRARWLDEPSLLAVLSGVTLDRDGTELLPWLTGRALEVAKCYGATKLDAETLISLLETHLADHPSGTPWPTTWLAEGHRALWSALGRMLSLSGHPGAGASPEEKERWVRRHPDDAALLARLEVLPLCPDQDGLPRRAHEVWHADAALRSLYGPHRPFVHLELAHSPTPEQRALLHALPIQTTTARVLLSDLEEPTLAQSLLAHAGPLALHGYLAQLDAALTEHVGLMPIFPMLSPDVDAKALAGEDVAVVYRSLFDDNDAGYRAWLTPDDAFLSWLLSLASSAEEEPAPASSDIGHCPPLLLPALCRAHSRYLRRLGGEVLDLGACLELLRQGRLSLRRDDLDGLHGYVEEHAGELTPRLCRHLAEARIFPDGAGSLRSLSGEERAYLPAPGDAAIESFAPDAPWLGQELRALQYLHRLPVEVVGVKMVVRLLVDGVDTPLYQSESLASLRRAYRYLLAQRDELLPRELQALVEAPIWLDREGHRHALGALQAMPDDSDVMALFYAFEARAMIEGDGDDVELPVGGGPTALEVVEGLDVRGALLRPDLALLIERLPSWEVDWVEHHESWRSLRSALQRAHQTLPSHTFKPILELPIFVAVGGSLLPLGRWQDGGALETGRVHRTDAVLEKVLAHSSIPILTRDETLFWRELLDDAGVSEADVMTLLDLLERDVMLEKDGYLVAALAREAFVALREALPRDETTRARLSLLPIWPSEHGHLLPASQLLVPYQMRAALGEALEGFLLEGEGTLLAQEAWEEATSLQELFAFSAPIEQLLQQIRDEIVPGKALVMQPVPFDALESLLQVTALLCEHEGKGASLPLSLPLSLDADSCLQMGPLWYAEGDAMALARKVSLRDALASPVWAQEALTIDEGLVQPLSSSRLLREVVQLAKEHHEAASLTGKKAAERADKARAALDALCHDSIFYGWLEEALEEFVGDAQMLGLLGNAPLLKTASGEFKSPRSLLWVVSGDVAASLKLDAWRCHDDIPLSLQQRLQALFQLEDKALERLIGVLAEAHQEAQSEEDAPRSQAILHAIAEALPLDEGADLTESLDGSVDASDLVVRLARRHKLARLRVQTADGHFARIGKLIFPAASHLALLDTFLETPYPQIHGRYDTPALRRFFAALGAPSHLPVPQLKGLLKGEGREESLASQLALAQYLASLLDEVPSLRTALPLQTAAWVPDGTGVPRVPGELYWPAALSDGRDEYEITELIGEAPSLYPHPTFFRTVPEEIASILPFRRAKDAQLTDLLAHLGSSGFASFAQLSWLEKRLRDKSIAKDVESIREAFAAAPLLRDDDGYMRYPDALICTPGEPWIGGRLATWSEGLRYSKLASTLGIPHRVGPSEVFAYGRALTERLANVRAGTLLREEPALHERLPRCLALLGERKAQPTGAMPILATSLDGQRTIVPASAPALTLPVPLWLVDVARQRELPLLFPVCLDDAEELSHRWLRSCGIGGLDAAMTPEENEASEGRVEDVVQSGGEASSADAANGFVAPEQGSHRVVPRDVPTASEEEEGLWSRFKRWWGDEPDPSENPYQKREMERRKPAEQERKVSTPSTPGVTGRGRGGARRSQPEEHGQWFRSRPAIQSQLKNDGQRWLEDRKEAPHFGFAFAPSPLPYPQMYAPQIIAERFQRQTQRWGTSGMPRSWRQAATEDGYQVAVEGSIPGGENLFPLPLYSRLDDVSGEGVRVITGQNGQVFLMARTAVEISCVVTLSPPPAFEGYDERQYQEGESALPPILIQPTVPDKELPGEVLDWIDEQQDLPSLPLERALAVREFIRSSYRYDPSYIEDPAVAQWLSRVSRGRANVHIAALHAGRDQQHLGRGVCYELGALACELMRRLGVPAAVSSGWTWESGQLAEPDHMWAMALLPSDVGLRWLPIDPSTTATGRPLRVGQRPPGTWEAKAPKQRKPRPAEPSWGKRAVPPQQSPKQPPKQDEEKAPSRPRQTAPPPRRSRSRSHAASRRPSSTTPPKPRHSRGQHKRDAPVTELIRVIRHAQRMAGETPDSAFELRELCETILENPSAAKRLLKIVDKK